MSSSFVVLHVAHVGPGNKISGVSLAAPEHVRQQNGLPGVSAALLSTLPRSGTAAKDGADGRGPIASGPEARFLSPEPETVFGPGFPAFSAHAVYSPAHAGRSSAPAGEPGGTRGRHAGLRPGGRGRPGWLGRIERLFAAATALDRLPPPFDAPDLVVFHSIYIPAHALAASRLRARGIPYVIVAHGGMSWRRRRIKPLKKALGNRLFFKKMVKNAAAVHCLTRGEAVETGTWGRPIVVCGNGTDPGPRPPAREWKREGVRFVFLGRIEPHQKGLDLLLKGVARRADALRDAGARFDLYGPDESNGAVGRMAARLGVEDLVSFGGPVTGGAKAAAYAAADVFVLTSRFEGHPVSVLEALASGLPCLLTPGTNVSAEAARAGAGWEVAPTEDEIGEALVRAARADASVLAAAGACARELAERTYSWRVVAGETIEEYRRLLGLPPGSAGRAGPRAA